MNRTVIGVVSNLIDRGPGLPYCKLNAVYADAIWAAGGLPVVLPPTEEADAIDQFLDGVGGVMFGGGYDVLAERFGQPPHPAADPMARRLDGFLFAAVARVEARLARLAVLGICLGAQVFNVARGGTLHQHLPDVARPGARPHSPGDAQYVGARQSHPVRIEPGSRLARAIGAEDAQVNSGHHQAIDRVGRGLRVTAHSDDGVIEAVEDPAAPFLLAVQWHPEEMGDQSAGGRLFEALVAAAARMKASAAMPVQR